jgi:SAM-dependent methyltransferase
MSGATVGEFLAYWRHEGDLYWRRGDYGWMAGLSPGARVLEIGCGLGFGTAALVARGAAVLAVDSLPECLDATRQRLASGGLGAECLLAEITALEDAQAARIAAFEPDTVACWLMGAPASVTGAGVADGGKAVAAYRETVHRAVAELAARLPSVRWLHLVDRTVIPWQAKDIGRDTLVAYHAGKTLAGLPFAVRRQDALYRRLEADSLDLAQMRRAHPSLKGVTPVLASLLAERTT